MNRYGRIADSSCSLACRKCCREAKILLGLNFSLLALKGEAEFLSCERRLEAAWCNDHNVVWSGARMWVREVIFCSQFSGGLCSCCLYWWRNILLDCCSAKKKKKIFVFPCSLTVLHDHFWKLCLPLLRLIGTWIKTCKLLLSFLFIFGKKNPAFWKSTQKEANTRMPFCFMERRNVINKIKNCWSHYCCTKLN